MAASSAVHGGADVPAGLSMLLQKNPERALIPNPRSAPCLHTYVDRAEALQTSRIKTLTQGISHADVTSEMRTRVERGEALQSGGCSDHGDHADALCCGAPPD